VFACKLSKLLCYSVFCNEFHKFFELDMFYMVSISFIYDFFNSNFAIALGDLQTKKEPFFQNLNSTIL